MKRREFLEKMGSWSAGVLLTAVGMHVGNAKAADFEPGLYPRQPLDGACLVPGSKEEQTLAALVDTVVPGRDTDPEGAPGALEGCALNLLLDEYYPFKDYLTLIVTLVDGAAKQSAGTTFLEATYEQRLKVLVEVQTMLPVLRLAYRAIRSAFYGGAYNGLGLQFLGYPGGNLGYRHLKEASFRKPVCKEMTDGWMP
jgi:hypothetical protein